MAKMKIKRYYFNNCWRFNNISSLENPYLIYGTLDLFDRIPCSIVGGYAAGRLKVSMIPSGAASGLAAGIILMLYAGISYGDWPISVTGGVIMAIIWIIGGVLGDLLAIIGKNRM